MTTVVATRAIICPGGAFCHKMTRLPITLIKNRAGQLSSMNFIPFLKDLGGLGFVAVDTPIRLPVSVTNSDGKATEIPTNDLNRSVESGTVAI